MNPTITTEDLLALTKSADLLRQTAEKAMRFDEAERLLTDHIRSWGQLQEAMPEPDINDTPEPLVKRIIRRLNLVDSLKKELEVVGNHAICRLNVLGEIHRILGSDGGTTGVSDLTGVPPQLYRLPKRTEQLVRELHSTRNDRDHLAGILENIARVFDRNPGAAPKDFRQLPKAVENLVRENAAIKDTRHAMWKRLELVEGENETLARNMPPEPRADSVFWNPYNGVVQDHRDGTVIQPDTDKERAKRGLPPFAPDPVNEIQPYGVTKALGQQWCRCERENDVPKDTIGLRFTLGGWICLCNVHQDTATGALTYHPVAVKDLPTLP